MKLIMIHSFKGGSGKTLFSVNVAEELAEQGKKVLLVETDFTMPVFHSIFSGINPDIFFNHFLEGKDINLNNYTYSVSSNGNLNIIFADPQFNPRQKIFSQDQNWFLNKIVQLKNAIEQLEYDYILFDTTPGSTLFMINLLLCTNHIFIMMRMDNQSIDGSISLIEEIYSKTINLERDVNVDIIFNQIPKVEQIKPVMDEIKQRFKIKFPYIKQFFEIEYDHYTSYLTTIKEFILPTDDPTRQRFAEIASNI